MVKHTQAFRWLLSTNCLSVFQHFAGMALKGLTHFLTMFQFYSLLKTKENVVSRGFKGEQWPEMD